MLNTHGGLVAATADGADTEHFHQRRKFFWTACLILHMNKNPVREFPSEKALGLESSCKNESNPRPYHTLLLCAPNGLCLFFWHNTPWNEPRMGQYWSGSPAGTRAVDLGCMLETPGELLKIPIFWPHPRLIKWEFLRGGPRCWDL